MTTLDTASARHRNSSHAPRTRLDWFPRHRGRRWLLRLGFALPYLAIAVITNATTTPLETPNTQLLERLSGIAWDRADPEWIGQIYPPISTLLAVIIPGGSFGLSIAGALIAGIFLQKIVEIMVQRQFPPSTAVILTIALAVNPLFAYTALENLAGFLGLAFFGLAVSDVTRFVVWRNTRAGFRAGILLMLATLSDLSGVVYVVAVAVAAPFLRQARADQPGARGANVLVAIYPTVAALAALFALNAVFTGALMSSSGLAIFDGTAERWAALGPLFTTLNGWLLVAPVLSAWLIAIIVRRPGAIIVSTLIFVAVRGADVIGLIPASAAGITFILMTVLAIALIPTANDRSRTVLVNIVAALQIVIAWVAAFNREVVVEWMRVVVAALGL